MALRRTLSVAVLCVAAALLIVAAALVTAPADAVAAAQDSVRLAPGATIALATPPFLQAGKRYAFTWAGGGPAQTYTVKSIRPDGWVLVDVAEETINPALLVPGEFPTRWLNIGIAISIQEMRPVP